MEKDRNDKNIGKKLDGRYEITERIGEGGMADVYRANDVVDHKTVAVKILKKEFAENEEFLRRFRNESKAIALLSHPNIVKVYDVGFSERIQFIVMEYIDGITLNEYMEQSNPLDWKDAAHFVMQILRALQHAHSKGIVHRDIKPQNIMMLRDGTIKVMDFGIAKFARENGKTCTDKAIGTVHYISPEQARGAETDEKSDLYSVGVLLFEMLTGKKPFDTETNDPVSIAVMHMQKEVPRPTSIRPGLATGLEEIILKAMQKEPEKRYQSAKEMMDDIEAFKEIPTIVFGYFPELTGEGTDESKTRFFTPIAQETPAQEEDEPEEEEEEFEEEEEEEEDEDDEDEYEEEGRASLFVPILTAVIIVVAIVGVFFATNFITNFIKSGTGSNTMEQWKMPDLIGKNYQEATNQYNDKLMFVIESYEYSDFEKDIIFYQSIPADNPVAKGDKVSIKISKGTRTIILPDYTGWDYETAKAQIVNLGLMVEPHYMYSDDVAEGKIISTDPAGTSSIEPGSTVMVTVSRGENIVTINTPNFVGMTWDVAKETAELYELEIVKVEVPSGEDAGKVLEQDIAPMQPVTKGSKISLRVSNGTPPETTIKISFAIPTDAQGHFHINFYEGGALKKEGPSFDVALAGGATYVEVTGTGKMEVLAILTNEATGATCNIGTYALDFEKKTSAVLSSDIAGAFQNVGGLVTVTTTAASTAAQQNTTAAPPTTTAAPATTTPAPETTAPATTEAPADPT